VLKLHALRVANVHILFVTVIVDFLAYSQQIIIYDYIAFIL